MASDDNLPRQPRSDFPPPQFPTVFVDGVMSLVNSPTIVKFFLARIEPSFQGDGQSQMQAIAQVVMPVEGFAMMFAFFEAQIRTMISSGVLSEARLQELRKIFRSGEQP